MSKKITLKTMRCPTCGGNLKAENNKDSIICVYCGNTIVPIVEAPSMSPSASVNEQASAFNGVLRVEGIKTSSSALAYIEQFYEEYDWETFAYAQTLSVDEIDKLVLSLKSSSADDKNTWFACFKAVSVPFLRKIEGCQQILNSLIEEYKENNLDAYSKFDAYKRVSAMILAKKSTVVANLEKFVAKAERYGALPTETAEFKIDIQNIINSHVIEFNDIESIPAIQEIIAIKNATIASELASKGIDAYSEYIRAKRLIEEKNYAEALTILLSLKGYSDTAALIEKVDKYYLLNDVLEIEGKLYYFIKQGYESETLDLYPTLNGKISSKAIITNILQIITNYADILYYLDGDEKLKKYNLSSNKEEKIYNKRLSKKSVFVYNRRVFLLSDQYSESGKDIVELDLATGNVKILIKNVKKVVSLIQNKLIYTASEKVPNQSGTSANRTSTNIINLDTLAITSLGTDKLTVVGFVQNYAVCTKKAPNEYNQNLYVKMLDSNEPKKLIEQNIYSFKDIISDKLFYYIGNSKSLSLININPDGTERREWPLYISKVLFEQGGWLYFIRKAGYNSILCKSRLNGSKFSIIAADIDEFIEIKNGYLYYINSSSALIKVRMDGSNLQTLCENVESVLAVKEDKIIFVSTDDIISSTNEYSQTSYKSIKSIYAVDFSGSGKIKLAYNIEDAKNYDENTVYYIATKKIKSSDDSSDKNVRTLYKLDVESNRVEQLLDFEIEKEAQKSPNVMIAIICMISFLLLGIIGLVSDVSGLTLVGLVGVLISLMVVCYKFTK